MRGFIKRTACSQEKETKMVTTEHCNVHWLLILWEIQSSAHNKNCVNIQPHKPVRYQKRQVYLISPIWPQSTLQVPHLDHQLSSTQELEGTGISYYIKLIIIILDSKAIPFIDVSIYLKLQTRDAFIPFLALDPSDLQMLWHFLVCL